ncbi:HTH-type transcriptional regulator MntR [subsurface metagenome]
MINLTSSLEDYLEAIWMTSLKKKVVRVKDIVEHLGVKAASVVEAMSNLREKGFYIQEKYGYIELTPNGNKIAKNIYKKHKILSRFLKEVLDVEKETAADDACRIEHHVSKKTLNKIIKFIKFIDGCPEGEPICLSKFRSFVKNGVRPEPCKKK